MWRGSPARTSGAVLPPIWGTEKHSCANRCIFCFIDQLPPGMRKSLYFKDDDERLSFLFGNYITMTNMHDHEIDRIIRMHISPINISVHTTNPELRSKMLVNRRGGETLKYLYPPGGGPGIAVNCQLVLCRGGERWGRAAPHLDRPAGPRAHGPEHRGGACGITDYRQGLYPQVPYDAATSAEVIDIMEAFGDQAKARYGARIVYPSDEWYLCAGRPIPPAAFYEDYAQLENGVGMWRLYEDSFRAELARPHAVYGEKKMDVGHGDHGRPPDLRHDGGAAPGIPHDLGDGPPHPEPLLWGQRGGRGGW